MTRLILLVDFGASRIKSAIWSDQAIGVIAVRECPAPSPTMGPLGEVEVAPEAYWAALEATAGALLEAFPTTNTLWLCAEMHGCLLGAAGDGSPLTPYISWRDARSDLAIGGDSPTMGRLDPVADEFLAETGMRLRPGLPFVTLAHLKRVGFLPNEFRLFTLVDWLLWRGGEQDPGIHGSLAAGTGLYSVRLAAWSTTLPALGGFEDCHIQLPRVVAAGDSLGRISLAGRQIEVFGGLGDLQAAAHGAGFPEQGHFLVNLGTGSQVLRSVDESQPGVDLRPGATSNLFSAITHIPAGRALNVFAGFMDGCALEGGGSAFFWKRFSELDADAVLAAPAVIDLNVFPAAWEYTTGGSIRSIHEGRYSTSDMLASLAKSWLCQYAKAMDRLDPAHSDQAFLLSGGLSRRAAFILPVLEALSGRKGRLASTATEEETLDGLLGLAMLGA